VQDYQLIISQQMKKKNRKKFARSIIAFNPIKKFRESWTNLFFTNSTNPCNYNSILWC